MGRCRNAATAPRSGEPIRPLLPPGTLSEVGFHRVFAFLEHIALATK